MHQRSAENSAAKLKCIKCLHCQQHQYACEIVAPRKDTQGLLEDGLLRTPQVCKVLAMHATELTPSAVLLQVSFLA